MSLEQWRSNGWLKSHRTDATELGNLLAIADRDLADAAAGGLSSDWKFGIAYNAALKLCTMLLYDAGYMPEKSLAHYRTLCPSCTRWAPGGRATRTISTHAGPSGTTSNTTMSTGLRQRKRRNFSPLPRTCAKKWSGVWRRSIRSLPGKTRERANPVVFPPCLLW